MIEGDVTFTSRDLNDAESSALMDWLFDQSDCVVRIEQMTVKEIKRIIPLWENHGLLSGSWTVSFTDIEVAVLFRLKWCDQ